jgi:hypothetical protein
VATFVLVFGALFSIVNPLSGAFNGASELLGTLPLGSVGTS